MTDRLRSHCPICGVLMFTSMLPTHVGSARCLNALYEQRKGRLYDPDNGTKVLDAKRAMATALFAAAEKERQKRAYASSLSNTGRREDATQKQYRQKRKAD